MTEIPIDSSMERVEKDLTRMIKMCKDAGVPGKDCAFANECNLFGEYDVAWEHVVALLAETDTPIQGSLFRLIESIAKKLDKDESLYLELKSRLVERPHL